MPTKEVYLTKSIDKNSPLPMYYQLKDILIEQIETGQLREHDQLPSERELCDTFQVSRTTVRQAMMELENEGYIYKQHGKGSYISPKVLNQSLKQFYSFTEEMKKLGKVPVSKVTDFKTDICDSKHAKKMKLRPDEKVYVVTRLRLADGVPMLYETSYIPVRLFPNLSREDLEKESMYDVFRKRYQRTITKAVERFAAVKTKPDEARMLEVAEDVPSMMIERTTYDQNEIIEYTVGISRGDKFSFSVELE